jgi:hypothetical protein
MKNTLPEIKKRGRPKKYEYATDRVKHYRERKQGDGQRLDLYISIMGGARLSAITRAWSVSRGQAIERLLAEADEKYKDILVPETELSEEMQRGSVKSNILIARAAEIVRNK